MALICVSGAAACSGCGRCLERRRAMYCTVCKRQINIGEKYTKTAAGAVCRYCRALTDTLQIRRCGYDHF